MRWTRFCLHDKEQQFSKLKHTLQALDLFLIIGKAVYVGRSCKGFRVSGISAIDSAPFGKVVNKSYFSSRVN